MKERIPKFIVKKCLDKSQRWHCLSFGVEILGVWIGTTHLHHGGRFNCWGATGRNQNEPYSTEGPRDEDPTVPAQGGLSSMRGLLLFPGSVS